MVKGSEMFEVRRGEILKVWRMVKGIGTGFG